MDHSSRMAVAALNIASDVWKDSAYEAEIERVKEEAQDKIRMLNEQLDGLCNEITLMVIERAWWRIHFHNLGYEIAEDHDEDLGSMRGRRLKLVKLNEETA